MVFTGPRETVESFDIFFEIIYMRDQEIIFLTNLCVDREKRKIKTAVLNIARFLGRPNISFEGEIPCRQQKGSDCALHVSNNIIEACRDHPVYNTRDVIAGELEV